MDAFHERTDDYNQSREKNQVWRWNFCKFCCIVLLFAPIRGANTHKKDTITVDDMKKEAEREARTMWQFIRTFLKWLVIAGVTGGIGGLVGSAFHLSVNWAAAFRAAHPWLLWLLPVGGLLIAAIYRLTKMENKNTNAIIDAIHFGDKVPLLLVPAIYLSTVITHLFGGSAGREGAALQIGGSLGCYIGQLFHLDEKDMRIATLCGMSAVFSALFGTPLTATIFALEVISVGVFYYSALVPCIVASLAALAISNALHVRAHSRAEAAASARGGARRRVLAHEHPLLRDHAWHGAALRQPHPEHVAAHRRRRRDRGRAVAARRHRGLQRRRHGRHHPRHRGRAGRAGRVFLEAAVHRRHPPRRSGSCACSAARSTARSRRWC